MEEELVFDGIGVVIPGQGSKRTRNGSQEFLSLVYELASDGYITVDERDWLKEANTPFSDDVSVFLHRMCDSVIRANLSTVAKANSYLGRCQSLKETMHGTLDLKLYSSYRKCQKSRRRY